MLGTLNRIKLTDSVKVLTQVVIFMRVTGRKAKSTVKAVTLVPINLFTMVTTRMI